MSEITAKPLADDWEEAEQALERLDIKDAAAESNGDASGDGHGDGCVPAWLILKPKRIFELDMA